MSDIDYLPDEIKKIDKETKEACLILDSLKEKREKAYQEYFIIKEECKFRNHIINQTEHCIIYNKDYDKKKLVGSYFSSNLKIQSIECFSKLPLHDYADECTDMGELADLLKKESISHQEANNAIDKFRQYGFKMQINDEMLKVLKQEGQYVPMFFSSNDEYYYIKIK